MEELIKKYLVEKAITDFKNDELAPNLLNILSKGEYSGYFREYIAPDDKDFLFEKLLDSEDQVRIFTGIVIRPVINLYNIEELLKYWENCTNPCEKDYFVYALADYKQLTEAQHGLLFSYIKSNLDFFIKSKRDYLRADLAFADLKKKIKGTIVHPITKKWIYWINILSYTDVITGDELIEFLNEINTSEVNNIGEGFYLEVKEFLFEKLLITNQLTYEKIS